MQRIEADFEIVTPMFLGGANNKTTAELRVPSIKGMLRFWWRALAWSRLGGDLRRIHAEESRIFGSADDRVGQGQFLMRAIAKPEDLIESAANTRLNDINGRIVMPGARYLGYGLMPAFGQNAGVLTRPCIREGGAFELEIRFRKPATGRNETETLENCRQSVEDAESVLRALKLFGLLGGLGSRTRRGWGSLALRRLIVDGAEQKLPKNKEDYADGLRLLIGNLQDLPNRLPEYSAFSSRSRIKVVHPSSSLAGEMGLNQTKLTSLQCLAAIGSALNIYRSWGRNERVRILDGQGQQPVEMSADRSFRLDHHWYKWFSAGADPTRSPKGVDASFHPVRVAFGLPHNYLGVDVTGVDADRRASPLLIHIHKIGTDQYFAAVAVMPSVFLPATIPRSDSEEREAVQNAGTFGRDFKKSLPNRRSITHTRFVDESEQIVMLGDIAGAARTATAEIDWDVLLKFLSCRHLDQNPANKIDVLGSDLP
jgi:CRISPR-associated protein Cmr1